MQRIDTAPGTLRRSQSDEAQPPAAKPVAPAVRDRAIDEYDHLHPLLVEFARRDPDDPRRRVLRDELLGELLPIVHHVASRYRNRGEPAADLEQVGTIGLMLALDRFDPERGHAFLSFAVPTITGEIRRHFRDRTWSMRVPRALKDLQGPVREAVVELSPKLGRAPRPSEIAAHLTVTTDLVIEALHAAHAHTADSLDAQTYSNGQPLAAHVGRLDTALDMVENRGALAAAFAQLSERERRILVLRFFDDMTQTQIGARLGISQMHVSRLLARALATLRGRIDA